MDIRKNIIWNFIGSVAPMIVGAVAVPYIYTHMGIERIGILTIIWALIGYFSIFDFGLGRAITQRIASLDLSINPQRKAVISTTGLILTTLIGVLGGLLGLAGIEFAGLNWVNSTKQLESEIAGAFFLACVAIPATTSTVALRGILEGEQHFKTINFLKLVLGLSNFLGPMASIALFGPRLDHTVGILVISRYAVLLLHFLYTKDFILLTFKAFSREETKSLFQFGGWMTLSNVLSPLMVVADRFLITKLLGAAVVAYYTVPAEFMIRLLVIPAAVTATLFPVFAKYLSNQKSRDALSLYWKGITFIFFMMTIFTLVTVIGGKYGLSIWLDSEFAEKSYTVAIILSVGVLFNSMAQIPHAYIQASGDARSTAVIHVFESILYLPGLLILTQGYGIAGAAWAWMLRALLDLIMLHTKATKVSR